MSLDGNCGRSGQTNSTFCIILPVGVVLCMLGQYWVFPPLAAIIVARCHGMLATRRCKRSTRVSSHLFSRGWWNSPNSGAVVHTGDCTTHPIHPKYVLWGCSLVILQAAPSWGWCLAEGNQGLSQHSEVWRHRIGSGSYSQNFIGERKRPFGTIVKSSPAVYWTTTSLDPISLAPLLEALTR